MAYLYDTCRGLLELARLGVLSGFRFKGAYWTWRMQTAFGNGMPSRTDRIKSVLEYARWVYRMRQAARS